MGDRWNPKTTPGGEHNATYVWGNLELNPTANGSNPDLVFHWEGEIVPDKL